MSYNVTGMTVDELLRAIAQGFYESPRQILLAASLFLGFVVLLVAAFFIQRARQRRRLEEHGLEVYGHLARRLGLSSSERRLADRLARYCRPAERRYQVLLSQHVFDSCAVRLRREEPVDERTLAALRIRLDFTAASPEDVPASTSELPKGTPVLLQQPGGPRLPGRVGSRRPDALAVTLSDGGGRPAAGSTLTVYFRNRAGIYLFQSHALEVRDRLVLLDHSESIRQIQRRRFYRRAVRIPVSVAAAGSPARRLQSTFRDLSGGGASLRNPGIEAQPGDELILTVQLDSSSAVIPARVVRLSAEGRVMHVRFHGLSEPLRDRIIGLVFRAQEEVWR